MDLSVVIPLFNAGDMLAGSVRRLTFLLDAQGLRYEILLCDDGSLDATSRVLHAAAGQYPRVKCFYNTGNRGLGFTLRKLFKEARGEAVVYCDCDLPFGERIIPVLLEHLKTHDVAVASRYRGEKNHVNIFRKTVSRAYYLLCKLLFNIPVADVGSGAVAIRGSALRQMNLKADGFEVHAEFYIQAARRKLLIREVSAPSSWCARGSFSILRHGPRILIRTINLRLQLLQGAV